MPARRNEIDPVDEETERIRSPERPGGPVLSRVLRPQETGGPEISGGKQESIFVGGEKVLPERVACEAAKFERATKIQL